MKKTVENESEDSLEIGEMSPVPSIKQPSSKVKVDVFEMSGLQPYDDAAFVRRLWAPAEVVDIQIESEVESDRPRYGQKAIVKVKYFPNEKRY